jgi:hypothetical protein
MVAIVFRGPLLDTCAGSKSIEVGPVPKVYTADRPLLRLESCWRGVAAPRELGFQSSDRLKRA